MPSLDSITHSLAASRIDGFLAGREMGERRDIPHHPPARLVSLITISRAHGVPGKETASRVAQELGFHVFDRQVLEAVEKNVQLGERIVSSLDHGQRSALESWIRGYVDFDHRIVDPGSFHHMVSRIIRSISLHGSAVVLGRGANFVLEGTDAFRVRLLAPLELRIQKTASGFDGLPPMGLPAARSSVKRSDAERLAFIRKNFHADIDDPRAYDAVFNLRRLDAEHAAGLILDAYRRVAVPPRPVHEAGPASGH